jgi:predicted nuclease with TOPRIM domain
MSETIDDKNYREIGELREALTARESELAAANERLRVTAGAFAKMESELAEAKRRVAELEGKLAQSTNYVADDELYPHVVWFANGRTVSIASGGHLEIGMGGRLAAAKGDVSDEP